MIPDKEAKTIQWGKKQHFQRTVVGKLDIHMQRNKLYPYLTPYTKRNCKWIKDLNARPQSIKILEENTKEKFHDIFHCNFLEILGKLYFYSTFLGSLANSEN